MKKLVNQVINEIFKTNDHNLDLEVGRTGTSNGRERIKLHSRLFEVRHSRGWSSCTVLVVLGLVAKAQNPAVVQPSVQTIQ